MNPVNQGQVKEFASTFDLSDREVSDQFELYSIYSVLNGGSGENVDPFDAHLRGFEFGIDGVAIVIQGNIVTNVDDAAAIIDDIQNPSIDFYFFQAKQSSSFDYGDISRFFDGISGFFNEEMRGESSQLDDLIEAKNYIYEYGIHKRNPGIHCYYATTGSYDKPARIERLIENNRNDFIDLSIFDEDKVSVHMLGAGELQRLYRAALAASKVNIEFDKSITLPPHESVDEGHIGYLPASELLKIISIYDDDNHIVSLKKSVFFDNIRDFNANSKINKSIAESMKRGESDNFVYRNNGITVVAKQVARTSNTFRIEDYQVVNGCQTSNVIFNNRQYADNVFVPFRLIGTRDEEFIFSIISGTNKQNPVRDEQFWSLLPFMKNLEEYARSVSSDRRIYLERRENQYRSESIERARIVQMQPFYKAITATLLSSPHRAARSYKSEVSDNLSKLFNEKCDVRPAYAVAYLHYRLEFLWRNQKIETGTKIYRFYIMDAVVRQILAEKSFLSLSDRNKNKFAKELVEFAASEHKMAKIVTKINKLMEKNVSSHGVTESREKLRDTIRSETFLKNIRQEYTPQAATV